MARRQSARANRPGSRGPWCDTPPWALSVEAAGFPRRLVHFGVTGVPWCLRSQALRHQGTPSPMNSDLAIFCGGLRFFGIPYGLHSVPRGLRAGGFQGRVVYWSWHERWSGRPGRPSLPALWDVALQDRHAERIARRIATHRRRHPEAKIHLLGCSAGGGRRRPGGRKTHGRLVDRLARAAERGGRPVAESRGGGRPTSAGRC